MREYLDSLRVGSAAAQRFLNRLYAPFTGTDIEFRCVAADRPVVRIMATIPVPMSTLDRLMELNADGYNIYYGVATRQDRKPHIVPALWVDIDVATPGGGCGIIDSKTKAQLALQGCDSPPTVIVDSGHGLHAYWMTYAGPDDHARVERLNRALAAQYGGDHVHDVARVMRLPGTWNVKADPWVRCACISHITSRRYALSELDAWLVRRSPEAIPAPGDPAPVPGREPRGAAALPGWLDDMIRNGPPPGRYPSRSEADFAVVAGLLRAGYTDDMIQDVFRSEAIGAKARELGAGAERYVARTINNARKRGTKYVG